MDTTRDYIAPALSELRYVVVRRPDDLDEREDADLVLEDLWDKSSDYARELVDSYEDLLENHTHYVEDLYDDYLTNPPVGPDGEPTDEPFSPPPAPSLVADEISQTAHLRRELDNYMKHLVVFAHQYALEDFSQSELSRLTGATRVTISRWLADDDLRRSVASVARARARQAVNAQKPADIKDKATASALGLLHWYAAAVTDNRQDQDREDQDPEPQDREPQGHWGRTDTDAATTGGDLDGVAVDRR